MKELFESSYLSIMGEENDRLRKEIEKLNNIVNELEYYFNQKIESLEESKEELNIGCKLAYKDSFNKLLELKGE